MPVFDIAAIREALPIEAVVADHGVRLLRGRGSCLVCGTSPTSVAFSVRGDRWRCFACGKRGDVCDLVAQLEGVPLSEAIRRCAAMAGLVPGVRQPVGPRRKSTWQLAREVRDAFWWRFVAALRERKTAHGWVSSAVRRLGPEDAAVIWVGTLLAEACDRELFAEYLYDEVREVEP